MNKVKFCTAEAIGLEKIEARLTVITSSNPHTLTKQYALEQGQLVKRSGGGVLVEGHAQMKRVSSLAEFGKFLTSLQPNQALAYGIPPVSETRIVTRDAWETAGRPEDALSRTNENFSWPDGPGILMLDYDPASEDQALPGEELVDTIKSAVPGLRDVEFLWWPSASSMIKNSQTGEVLSGRRGQRLYVMVADARDIPRAGQAIADHLWLHGHGHIQVSKSGRLLERTFVDASVWQTSRLDFAAGAKCEEPLVQDRGDPVIIPGQQKVADTKRLVPDLSPTQTEALALIKDAAKAKKKHEAEAAKEAWLAARVDKMVPADASDDERQQAWSDARKALEKSELAGDFILHVKMDRDTIEVSVADVLAAPEKYHEALTLDPLEPDYDGGRPVGKIFTNSPTPVLHSFAHGEKTYRLIRKAPRIEVIGGKLHKAVKETVAVLQQYPKLFDFGEDLVVVEDGAPHVLDEHALGQVLGEQIQYVGYTAKGEKKLIDPPANLLKRVLSEKSRRKLKKLITITTAPTLWRDGTLLVEPGFDAATGIFYHPVSICEPPMIPHAPTLEECCEALQTVMFAFRDFPFAEPSDRGAMLAAILTATVRPSLPTAPAFGFDAPAKGSGKTKLAECTAILAGSDNPEIFAPSDARNDDEMRKRLAARVFSGSRDLIVDNVLGVFNSPALAALLTSASYSDRILGKSHIRSAPNRLIVLVTGNNLALSEDLVRRFLVIRIDPQMERPYERSFDIDPVVYVRENRLQIIAAALTLIRAQLTSNDQSVRSKLGSFEDWSRLVGDTVRWVGKHVDESFGDPIDTIDRSLSKDPELEEQQELLHALDSIFGDEWFLAKDLSRLLILGTLGSSIKPRDAATRKEAVETIQYLLDAMLGGKRISPKTLGRILQNRIDRVADGLVLRRGPKVQGTVRWRVERLKA